MTTTPDIARDLRTTHDQAGSVQRLVSRRPLPTEVKEIMAEANRLQYRLMVEAGWCISCYRERASGTTRCAACNEIAGRRAEARARKQGIKPWKAGGRGRKPKSANNALNKPREI